MDIEFRPAPGPVSGSSASAEIAAVLKARPGEEAVIAMHPLPTRGASELREVQSLLGGATFPTTAAELAEAVTPGAEFEDEQARKLLHAVATTDLKKAREKDEAAERAERVEPRVYANLEEVLSAVLRELQKRVRARASSLTGVIKDGRVKAFTPAGTFTAISRTEKDEAGGKVVTVFATYLGEEHARPPEEQPAARRRARRDQDAVRAPAFPTPETDLVTEGVGTEAYAQ